MVWANGESPVRVRLKLPLAVGVVITLVSVALFCVVYSSIRKMRLDPEDSMYWVSQLQSGGTQARITAISVLSAVQPKDEKVVRALIVAVEDQEPQVRFAAVAALHDTPAAVPAINRALQDPDVEVRQIAAAALAGDITRGERRGD